MCFTVGLLTVWLAQQANLIFLAEKNDDGVCTLFFVRNPSEITFYDIVNNLTNNLLRLVFDAFRAYY